MSNYVPNPRAECTSPTPCPDPCATQAWILKRQTQPLDCYLVTEEEEDDPCVANLDDNLVAYWDMDSIPDTDDIGARATTNGGDVILGAGILGSAASFPGTANSRLTVPDDAALRLVGVSITIRLWFYTPAIQTLQTMLLHKQLLASHTGWKVGIQAVSGGSVPFFLFGNGTSSLGLSCSSAITPGKWQHVVVVRDAVSGTSYIYLDSVLENSNNVPQAPIANTDILTIGEDAEFPTSIVTERFIGNIDEILISTFPWTQCEVTADYNNNVGRTYPFA